METRLITINQKLGFISETMSDGYHFLQMRSLFEQMEKDAQGDDIINAQSAEKILDMVNKFYNVCVYVRRRG